jgi:hypothetical protein
MNQQQTRKAATAAVGRKNPDVIVTRANQTTLFKMQNRQVSEWLHRHYRMSTENAKGDTEFRVHPTRCKRIVEELKAAGFIIQTL